MRDDEQPDEIPRRFRTLRPGPLRDVLPWVVLLLGVVLAGRGVFDVVRHEGPTRLLIGLALVLVGVVVSLVNRWQARRGH